MKHRKPLLRVLGRLMLRMTPLLIAVPALAHSMPLRETAPAVTEAPTATLLPATPPPAAPTPSPAPTPAPRYTLGEAAPYIPILMYHYIREVDRDADPLGFRLSVRPDRFAEHLAWLRERGYVGLRMRDLAACLRANDCPRRAVALTFDDGYADNVTTALPLLRRHGFVATFYIVTGFVGREGYMDWEDLALLRDSGMELGAHTVSHADLAALDLGQARHEILASRQALEERLGIEVVSFSYPAGSYTSAVRRLIREAGFSSAVTTAPAERLERLDALPRRRVLGGETLEGYHWYFVPPVRAGRP
ncbi:MAG: polysaccharide deacetylase family protein [Chloroflexaceae bacterium]|nr:polysaccharide deacetylase family protein [Chloroflexaceae bacterium]